MNLPQKNAFEWTVFAVSLLLVLGVLGYLSYQAITDADRPANMLIELGEVEAQPENTPTLYKVPVTVRNTGGQTAEEVLIAVTLEIDGEEAETAELTIPQLPYHSLREGAVAFSQDPRQGQLTAKVVGYLQP